LIKASLRGNKNETDKNGLVIAAVVLLAGYESTYYSAMESIGSHKRDILVDRIEDPQEAQQDTQEQFKEALEQYRSIVQFDGGDYKACTTNSTVRLKTASQPLKKSPTI
jgi:hypothetical protein